MINNIDRLKQYWAEVKAGLREPPAKSKPQVFRRRVRVGRDEWIVKVYSHGELGFRSPGRRYEYRLSMADAIRSAAWASAQRINRRMRELIKEGHRRASAKRQAHREVLGCG